MPHTRMFKSLRNRAKDGFAVQAGNHPHRRDLGSLAIDRSSILVHAQAQSRHSLTGICVCDVEMYTPPICGPRTTRPSEIMLSSGRDHPLPCSSSDHLIPQLTHCVRIGRPYCCRARGAGALRGDVWILSWCCWAAKDFKRNGDITTVVGNRAIKQDTNGGMKV